MIFADEPYPGPEDPLAFCDPIEAESGFLMTTDYVNYTATYQGYYSGEAMRFLSQYFGLTNGIMQVIPAHTFKHVNRPTVIQMIQFDERKERYHVTLIYRGKLEF